MGDDDDRSLRHQVSKSFLDQHLRLGIEMRGGFVEDQDGRVAEDGSGYRQTLALASTEFDAALADTGFIAFGHAGDEFVGDRCGSRGFDFFERGIGAAVADVVGYRVVEQEGVLRDRGDLCAKAIHGDVTEVPAIDSYAAFDWIIETGEEAGEGGLACAAWSYEGNDFACVDAQGEALEDVWLSGRAGGIAKADLLEFDRLVEGGQRCCVWLVGNLGFLIEILEDALGRAGGLLEDILDASETLDGLVKHQEGYDEAGELAGCHLVSLDLRAGVADEANDGEGSEEFDDGRGERLLGDVAEVRFAQGIGSRVEARRLHRFCIERTDDLLAGDRFLEDVVEVGGIVLRATGGAADALAEAGRGDHHEGEDGEREEGELPIVVDQDGKQADGGEALTKPVGEHVRDGDLDLFDVVHHRRHEATGGVDLEEAGVLTEDMIEDALAEVGDGV